MNRHCFHKLYKTRFFRNMLLQFMSMKPYQGPSKAYGTLIAKYFVAYNPGINRG